MRSLFVWFGVWTKRAEKDTWWPMDVIGIAKDPASTLSIMSWMQLITQKYYTANPILSLLLSPLYGAKWVFCYLRGTLALPADSPCGDAYISSLLRSRHIQMAHRWVNIATVLPERCFMGENEGIMDYERVLVQGTKWWRITTKMVAQNLQQFILTL